MVMDIFSHLIAAVLGAVIMAQLIVLKQRPAAPRRPLEGMAPRSWPLPAHGPDRDLALLELALNAASDAYYYLRNIEEEPVYILSVSCGLVNLIKIRRDLLQRKLHPTPES